MVALITENLIQAIRQVGDPIARALGVEILDLECTGKPTNPLVRLTLDKDGGVGIAECEQFHQSLRRTWEITQPSGPPCRFEVSSPGLDRPLKDQKDFQRVQGERLRVTLRNDTEKNAVVIGRLIAVTDTGLQLVDDRNKAPLERFVAWDEIVKAKIEIEF
jgi:ribosome maturation factor RimP